MRLLSRAGSAFVRGEDAIAIAALVPLLFWPFSKTIWASVDHLIYRTSPDYGSREAADRASGNGGRP